MIDLSSKKKFIKRFSNFDWELSGHDNPSLESFKLQLWEDFFSYIKEGKLVDLGCGSGILCRFIYEFCEKEVRIFGVDHNKKGLSKAKKINPELKNNFFHSDFFNLERGFFEDFSTVLICGGSLDNKTIREKFQELLTKIGKEMAEGRVIFYSYDFDLTQYEADWNLLSGTGQELFECIEINSRFVVLKKNKI